MSGLLRLFGIGAVYVVALIAWLVLGGVTTSRSREQNTKLDNSISSLWGVPQIQAAPELTFFPKLPAPAERQAPENVTRELIHADGTREILPAVEAPKKEVGVPEALGGSSLDVSLHSEPRRKGLVWYALYAVQFDGTFKYEHADEREGRLKIRLALPEATAIYDNLVFQVNGQDQRAALDPASGAFELVMPIKQGEAINFRAGYRSRGSDTWSYRPAQGVQRLDNFSVKLHTNFDAIDFPERTLSPSSKVATAQGWDLDWLFQSTITGQGIGMTMPKHIQPGELASALAFSAPVSLLFFFVVLFVLATLRGLEIHPVNYLFIASAFFAFHLLFSYSVDHLSVPWAFALASGVSLGLVVSYLRLVVSTRFALRETALAQFVYLIVFSLAHFWEGFTGLTVTVLAILTLFVLMQATGKVRWSRTLSAKHTPQPTS